MTTTITAMPTAPQRTDTPAVFVTRADATVAAWPQFITETNTVAVEINTKSVNTDTNAATSTAAASAAAASAAAAAISAASAVAASTTNATSSTSTTIGTGSKTFTTQSSKNFVNGMWVTISSSAGPTNYMYGYVTSYSGTTLIVTVVQIGGSGTLTDWIIALSAPQATILTPLNLATVGASVRPTLLLDFANSRYFDPRISFTRATAGGRYNSLGLYESMPAGSPRLDYNPATGESLGLLIEEARTNSITKSAEFDHANWTKDNVTITANAILSPDGTLVADTMTANAGAITHDVNQSFTATAVPWTMSAYAKAGTASWFALSIDTEARFAGAFFNLTTGVVGTVAASGTATIQDVGGGWYRCTLTRTLTAASRAMIIEPHTADAQAINWNAAGTETVQVWGADAQAGGFATSHIPTTTVAVTRNIDLASMVTVSPWFNSIEGTIYATCDTLSATQSATHRIASFNDGTDTNVITMYLPGPTGDAKLIVDVASVNQCNLTSGTTSTDGVQFKAAASYKANSFNICKDASAIATDTAGTIPTITSVALGTARAGTVPLNGHIKKFAYYPKQLSSAELVAITTA